MWNNYFKVALRALLRNRIYTIINLLGLSLGIAVCLLIFLYIQHEFSYNRYLPDSEHLYRVVSKTIRPGTDAEVSEEVSAMFAETFNEGLPGLEGVARVVSGEEILRIDEVEYRQNYRYVDPNFPTLFRIEMLEGDPATALKDREGAIISQQLAEKLFGEGSAMGRRFELNVSEGYRPFVVRGVTATPPSTTTIPYDLLIPLVHIQESLLSHLDDGWNVNYSQSYVRLAPNTNVATVEAAIEKTLSNLDAFRGTDSFGDEEVRHTFHLQPFNDLHLALRNPQNWPTETGVTGPLVLLAIGFGVLLIACINFTTLAIGRSTTRALEVGVRKVMGAHRGQIMRQFWLEVALLTFLAMIIGYGATELMLPAFSTLAERTIEMTFNGTMIAAGIGIWLLLVFAAGSYPAIVMSGFTPIGAIRGKLRVGGKARLRQVLVFIQFSLAVTLVAITLIMASQLTYINRKELGYRGDQVVNLEVTSLDSTGAVVAERMQTRFANDPGVLGVTGMSCAFDADYWTTIRWRDETGKLYEGVQTNCVRPNFIEVMNIQLLAGRNFEEGSVWDHEHAMIINEAMVDFMAWENPIGQTVPGFEDTEVIGVVEDFHYATLHKEIQPLILQINPNLLFTKGIGASSPNWFTIQNVLVHLAVDDLPGTLYRIEQAWLDLAPEYRFEYSFVDEQVGKMYAEERRWSTIVRFASFFTIVIAALGLLGLATLEVAQRTREIGIRKVMGAEAMQIVLLLTRQITLLVLAGAIIAWPLAWFTMQRWLENFAYRVSLSPLLLLIATCVAVVVAWGTVGILAWRAASADPVHALRHE